VCAAAQVINLLMTVDDVDVVEAALRLALVLSDKVRTRTDRAPGR